MNCKLLYGISIQKIVETTGVHVTTARRWKRTGDVPQRWRRFVDLVVNGNLGALAATWSGWTLTDSELVTPEGECLGPGQLRATRYHRALESELKRISRQPVQFELTLAQPPKDDNSTPADASMPTAIPTKAPCQRPRLSAVS